MSDTTPREPGDETGSRDQGVDPQEAAARADTGDVVVPRVDDARQAGSDEDDHDTQPRPSEHAVTDAYAEPPANGSWAPEPRASDDEAAAGAAVADRPDEPADDLSVDDTTATAVATPVSAGTHASADTGQPVVPATGAPEMPRPVYVTAPRPPKRKSNRGVGTLIAILGAVIFAVVYAAVAAAIGGIGGGNRRFLEQYLDFLMRPVFWIPVIFFALAMIVVVLILNRSRWWAYIIGGFFVAVVVYLSFIGAALLDVQAWQYTPGEVQKFLGPVWVSPFALAAGITAREVSIWIGAWLAARGRRVTARNAEAQADYERRLAEGPQLDPSRSTPA